MDASSKRGTPVAPRRKANREMRRQQFIDATIDTLARRGYARTTLTDVAATAGLSHGLIIFHFESKEKLLAETLLFLAQEYRESWDQALAAAPSSPAARLEALIRADFAEHICTPQRLAAWMSFWGEAQSRPIYQEHCGSKDLEFIHMLESLCADLAREGGYGHDPEQTARVLRVTLEGMWFNLLTVPSLTREEALRTVFHCASAFFPQHFDQNGMRQPA